VVYSGKPSANRFRRLPQLCKPRFNRCCTHLVFGLLLREPPLRSKSFSRSEDVAGQRFCTPAMQAKKCCETSRVLVQGAWIVSRIDWLRRATAWACERRLTPV
jgi:hypothetical protein